MKRTGRDTAMGKYFGTDGFRGEANVVLTVEDATWAGISGRITRRES